MTRRRLAVVALLLPVAVIAWHFPYASDDPVRREDAIKAFYEMTYSDGEGTAPKAETQLAKDAGTAAITYDVRGGVERFVQAYNLQRAAVLDVGSGSGYLQDVVDDYTGIDIARAAARFYHKRFVIGTATAMPFDDNAFDAAWSIWVIEHIPNPEAALAEIRRVVKPGGLLYLMPAWDVKPWAAQGYEARPYQDLGIGGKLVKASIPIRSTRGFWLVTTVPNRVVRSIAALGGPTRLHYRLLTPNYDQYWQADSDAMNSLDSREMAMWFESRGDSCLNCRRGRIGGHFQANRPLIIRLNAKKG